MIYDYSHALANIRPGALYHIIGPMNVYSNIVWTDQEQTKPTEQEILVEIQKLNEKYINDEYHRLRRDAYPSIQDQLDTLYHGGYDEWKAMITAVKKQFPKPE